MHISPRPFSQPLRRRSWPHLKGFRWRLARNMSWPSLPPPSLPFSPLRRIACRTRTTDLKTKADLRLLPPCGATAPRGFRPGLRGRRWAGGRASQPQFKDGPCRSCNSRPAALEMSHEDHVSHPPPFRAMRVKALLGRGGSEEWYVPFPSL